MNTKEMGWNLDNSYENLPKVFYSKIKPNIVKTPKLEILNESLGVSLGLDIELLKSENGLDILAGNIPVNGEELLAQAYAGHQFGYFTMLGDGRAALIGEQINLQKERYDIQLKGSGRTPYSRGGDGRAALGPMLREYIISEAIYSLGIPTSRSLAVVTTGEKIYRETALPGAILTRVAKSHIRVGTFQYAASFEDKSIIKSIADYTIKRHFPHIEKDENPYISLLKEVIKQQAKLISKWQLVGFVHGVMNTDNMTISGETIDYGPCAFMDFYDPNTVFSSIDRNGRYAYGKQPTIGAWNLARLAEALLTLISENEKVAIEIAEESIKKYSYLYNKNWLKGMRLKLGLLNEESEDIVLIEEFLNLMKNFKADFTNTFVGITEVSYKSLDKTGLFESEEFNSWNKKWKLRLESQNMSIDIIKETMKNNNPIVIPRNHLVEKALKSASESKDYRLFNDLLKVLSNPYDYENITKEYMVPPEESKIPYRTFCGT